MQQTKESIVNVKDTTANPAPLGLLAFGMTTILLNLHNAGLFEMGTMILAMGIFYGGIAQIVAGTLSVPNDWACSTRAPGRAERGAACPSNVPSG